MFPIWIKDGRTKKPDDKTYYTLAANGFFLTKETPYWNVTAPVKKISILEKVEPSFELLLPPIGKDVTSEMAQFFAWIYKQHRTEAAMLLWFNSSQNTYRVDVPVQEASYGGVHYTFPRRDAYRPDEVLMGTFHSHADMPAYHSGTDIEDEFSFDGIHGTFGGFSLYGSDKNCFQLSVQGVINGCRFDIDPKEFLMGLTPSRDTNVYRDPFGHIRRVSRAGLEVKTFTLASDEPLLSARYVPREEWTKNFSRRILPNPLKHVVRGDGICGT